MQRASARLLNLDREVRPQAQSGLHRNSPQIRILYDATARILTYTLLRAAPTQTMLPVFLAGRHPVGKQTRIAARRKIKLSSKLNKLQCSYAHVGFLAACPERKGWS